MTRSVNRALDVLEAIRDASQPLTLSELAVATQMDKATTMRILRDLAERNYVELIAGTKQYTLGIAILDLADRLWAKDSITQSTLRYLEDLRDKTLQTVALCTRSGDQYFITLELPSLEPIKYAEGVGTSKAVGAGAAGHVLIAFGRGGADLLERSAVQKIREDGYAYSVSETSPRVATVAAPVTDASGAASAVALSWILDHGEADAVARRRYSSQVMGCAQRISRLRQGQGRWG